MRIGKLHIRLRPHRRGRRSRSHRRQARMIRNGALLVLVLVIGGGLGFFLERFFVEEVENAEEQLTIYESDEKEPSIYVNDQWYVERDMETLLVIGVDDMGQIHGTDSYNNGSQADFMVLLARDRDANESTAIYINRDTMADIPVLGVTGETAGTRREQIALAYYYGQGEQDSCANTVNAVSNLLYGVPIEHYLAITMDAVPILNDWAGGVSLEIRDDFTGIDADLIKGQTHLLWGDDSLHYVQARAGVDDGTNLSRMQRQKQYAAAWFDKAQPLFHNYDSMADLLDRMEGYYYTDCTLEQMRDLAVNFSKHLPEEGIELAGEAHVEDIYMEYHVDEAALQALVLDLFYAPAEG